MKITLNKGVLEAAVTLCNAYADKKDSSSITSHLLFVAKDDSLTIKASDYEIGLSYKLNGKVKVEKEGLATVHSANFASMIKNLNNEDLTLESIETSLFIRQKGTKYKLAMFNYEDFPDSPSTDGKQRLDIDSSALSIGLKKILPAVDTNNPKPSLNGALIDIKKDKINFASTDTKRLAIYTLPRENEKEFAISVPKKAIMEMQKLFYEKIELFYDENVLIARNENFEFFTKLINDKFPDYEKVVPKSLSKHFSFKTDDFINAIKKISVVAEKMRVNFEPKKISFEGASLENTGMEAKTELEIEVPVSENFSINIAVKSLNDFLTSIESEDFDFDINDGPNLPFIVRSGELQTVIMPAIL